MTATLQPAVAPPAPPEPITAPSVAVIGLGYVGLPTSLALVEAGYSVIGIDASPRRIDEVQRGVPDLLPGDTRRLAQARRSPERFRLSEDASALRAADTVLICVPTPVDRELRPNLRHLQHACASVVTHARHGQAIVLTSTTSVGSTRELLVEPLGRRGLRAGKDVFVAFSPERIDPGNTRHEQTTVPRVLGGATPECADAVAAVLGSITPEIHRVSSPEAAELTKLYENTFRAVNIAFANEMASASRAFGLDPLEVGEAAATKPYGFMRFTPGPGVGGHCIPCDPYYLLAGLDSRGCAAPLTRRAMAANHARPSEVARRAQAVLWGTGRDINQARVLVVGVTYKPGIRDTRESPGVRILRELAEAGADVAYHDERVPSLELPGGLVLLSAPPPEPGDYDLVVVVTVHPGSDLRWLERCPAVLDCTYRLNVGGERFVA